MDESEIQRILKFHASIPDRIISRESNTLEFKESFNWNSKEKYASTVAAFSNNKGGYVFFGVKNQPRDLMGLQNNNFENIDEAKIAEYFNSVFSPELVFEKGIFFIKDKQIGILKIFENSRKPVISIKSSGDIQEGVVFYRYNARSEKIKYPELNEILEEIKLNERKMWMVHLEKISKIGIENALIVDTINGIIEEKGVRILIDKELLKKVRFVKEGKFKEKGYPTLRLIGDVKPVVVTHKKEEEISNTAKGIKISNDPKAPKVKIEEKNLLEEFSLNYHSLTENLRERYIDFSPNLKYHSIRKKIIDNGDYVYTRKLDPSNPKSSKQCFYHPNIISEFDKYYMKKV